MCVRLQRKTVTLRYIFIHANIMQALTHVRTMHAHSVSHMHARLHTCTHINTHKHPFAHLLARELSRKHTYKHVCTQTQAHVYTQAHVQGCIHKNTPKCAHMVRMLFKLTLLLSDSEMG